MTQLSKEQREMLLGGIWHRATRFPRASLQAKLLAADKAYHLANVRADGGSEDGNNQSDSYSRFQELDDALVREVAESYASYYQATFLGGTSVFSMTSVSDQQANASKYNAILNNQQDMMGWKEHLSTFFLCP